MFCIYEIIQCNFGKICVPKSNFDKLYCRSYNFDDYLCQSYNFGNTTRRSYNFDKIFAEVITSATGVTSARHIHKELKACFMDNSMMLEKPIVYWSSAC